MDILNNSYRNLGPFPGLDDIPWPVSDPSSAQARIARCPRASVTPLVDARAIADQVGVGHLWIKDERERMGLGSFKALGAAHVIARDHDAGQAAGQTYVTASAGNHGMSVAAGAAAFKARAVIYIAETVPEVFAERLRATGAEVVREGATYEDSMAAALRASDAQGWALLSDSSWPGYVDRPLGVMEGYLILMAEAARQVPEPPTHIFLQAGVGGLAAACAAYARRIWGDAPRIIVVEPDAAPALFASIRAGKAVHAPGPVSAMGRLDCKDPSLIALKGLARDADDFVLISEEDAQSGSQILADAGWPSTPSGAAGVAAAMLSGETLGLRSISRILCILSESPEA